MSARERKYGMVHTQVVGIQGAAATIRVGRRRRGRHGLILLRAEEPWHVTPHAARRTAQWLVITIIRPSIL